MEEAKNAVSVKETVLDSLVPKVKAATDVLESDSDKSKEEIFKGSKEEVRIFDQWWFPWLIVALLIILAVWYNRKKKKVGSL